jgi:hypothetical protein
MISQETLVRIQHGKAGFVTRSSSGRTSGMIVALAEWLMLRIVTP